ncbi:unnamed protein product, partial [Allacma fusca]
DDDPNVGNMIGSEITKQVNVHQILSVATQSQRHVRIYDFTPINHEKEFVKDAENAIPEDPEAVAHKDHIKWAIENETARREAITDLQNRIKNLEIQLTKSRDDMNDYVVNQPAQMDKCYKNMQASMATECRHIREQFLSFHQKQIQIRDALFTCMNTCIQGVEGVTKLKDCVGETWTALEKLDEKVNPMYEKFCEAQHFNQRMSDQRNVQSHHVQQPTNNQQMGQATPHVQFNVGSTNGPQSNSHSVNQTSDHPQPNFTQYPPPNYTAMNTNMTGMITGQTMLTCDPTNAVDDQLEDFPPRDEKGNEIVVPFQLGNRHQYIPINVPRRQRILRYDLYFSKEPNNYIKTKQLSDQGIKHINSNLYHVMQFIYEFEGAMSTKGASEAQYVEFFKALVLSDAGKNWKESLMGLNGEIKTYYNLRTSFIQTLWNTTQQENAKMYFIMTQLTKVNSIKWAFELQKWFKTLCDAEFPDCTIISTIQLKIDDDMKHHFDLGVTKNIQNLGARIKELTKRSVPMNSTPRPNATPFQSTPAGRYQNNGRNNPRGRNLNQSLENSGKGKQNNGTSTQDTNAGAGTSSGQRGNYQKQQPLLNSLTQEQLQALYAGALNNILVDFTQQQDEDSKNEDGLEISIPPDEDEEEAEQLLNI